MGSANVRKPYQTTREVRNDKLKPPTKPAVASPFITLSLESSSVPVYRQIYEGLRKAILSGQLGPRAALPSTRALAAQMGVSRLTVVSAYEQLIAEGYVQGKVGSGTYVASSLPEELLQIRGDVIQRTEGTAELKRENLSRRVRRLGAANVRRLRVLEERHYRAFQHGVPAVDEFPFPVWSRLASRRLKNPPRVLLGYGDPAGYRPLREAVAAYLRAARAVRCEADQVIITAGTQQALHLTTQVLLDAGEAAWVEEPCYPGTRGALTLAGAEAVPVPVDKEGLDVSAGLRRSAKARVAYVTPSHQFPLGVTMSLARRLALLEWAGRAGAWVVEDDYDSEYRYAGRPLASLQGLDQMGRVIYIGSFSKTIFPSLRLGCMVVPGSLIDAFVTARSLLDRHSPSLDQVVLTDFIEEGHFARHVRRMRALYAERHEALVAAARRDLSGLLEVPAVEAGMHTIGWLPEGASESEVSERAARHGVQAAPLSSYATGPPQRAGLLLGFTAVNARQIRDGVRRLARALK